jgi:hypothetical protein
MTFEDFLSAKRASASGKRLARYEPYAASRQDTLDRSRFKRHPASSGIPLQAASGGTTWSCSTASKSSPHGNGTSRQRVEHGRSRNVVIHHISTQLQERQGKARSPISPAPCHPKIRTWRNRSSRPLQLRLSYPSLNRQGEGTGAGFAHSPARPPARVGSWLRFPRQSGAAGGGCLCGDVLGEAHGHKRVRRDDVRFDNDRLARELAS